MPSVGVNKVLVDGFLNLLNFARGLILPEVSYGVRECVSNNTCDWDQSLARTADLETAGAGKTVLAYVFLHLENILKNDLLVLRICHLDH